MDSSDLEHVTRPADVTVSMSSGLSSISNSPLDFSLEKEACETLELSDILLKNVPNKPNDSCISENAVTDHHSDSLNAESLGSEEKQSNAVSSGKSPGISSSEDSDSPESVSIPSGKSSTFEAHAKEKNSSTIESVLVTAQEQDGIHKSVATDKSSADIEETSSSSDKPEISEKCISKTSFLSITKSTNDKSLDEQIVIIDKEEVNSGDNWKFHKEHEKKGKELKSCYGKSEKSHKVVDTKYESLETLSGSALESSARNDQNSSTSSSSAEKIARFEEEMPSSDRCPSTKEVTDSNEQPTRIVSSESQPGTLHLADNEMEGKGQGSSVADAARRDVVTEKISDTKQQCREIKQPIIKLADFMFNTSSKSNREDKKQSHKPKRAWAVKLTAPVSSLSRKRSDKEDKDERMAFEEQVKQSTSTEKSKTEKPFSEEEKVQVIKSKKEQTTTKEGQLRNKNEAPAIQAEDCNSNQLNTKGKDPVRAKVGFSLNEALSESESVSVEIIVSSSPSSPQQLADLNGEETDVGKEDAINGNLQNEGDAELIIGMEMSRDFLSHHPDSSKHAIPARKGKRAINISDPVPIDGKIPTIKLHKINHMEHLPSSSQTISENKMAKLRTEVTPGCSSSYDNTQSVHGNRSQAGKKKMPKHSPAVGKRKGDLQRSDPISLDGKVPIIKLQRICLGEKQEKGDMFENLNSLEEASDRKLRKRSLSPNQSKSKIKNKSQSPSKQSAINFETSSSESDKEDGLFSKELFDSLLEKVTAYNDQNLKGSELNVTTKDNIVDGDSASVMNLESVGLRCALGRPLATMSPIAGPSQSGYRYIHVSKRHSSRRSKSDADLGKRKSHIHHDVKKAGVDKRLMSHSSDAKQHKGLQKPMAVKESSDHQDEQQDVTCNDNSKDELPKDSDGVDPEVEALIRKLKGSDHKERKKLEPVVLLTRIDDEHINDANTFLKGYDLNFTSKKQSNTFGLKGNEKSVSSQKQMEHKSSCDSSQRLVVPLERLDSPIKTGSISRQSTDKNSKNKSLVVNGKHEESIKVEVHASWFEMDSGISDVNVKFKERNTTFETSPSPSKKVRKDTELNNDVLGTVGERKNFFLSDQQTIEVNNMESMPCSSSQSNNHQAAALININPSNRNSVKTSKKNLDSARVKCKNISENVWKLKPKNFPVTCATCAYLSSPDSRLIKEAYTGKDILCRHVIVTIQRLDREIDCASVSSLIIKERQADQRKRQAEGEKIKLLEEKEKHMHSVTEEEYDRKSNDMKSRSKSGRPWKLIRSGSGIECEAVTSDSGKEDAKSPLVKSSKVLNKKEESGLKDLCLPKGKHDSHGKDVHVSGEVDISIYSSRVKLEKLDMENTSHQFHLKIPDEYTSNFNPKVLNGESSPSSDGFTKDKSEGHFVTIDSGKQLSNKVSSCKQCITPSGKKPFGTGETLNRSSSLVKLPDDEDDNDETNDSNCKNQTEVTTSPGSDAELTKSRHRSAVRTDQKTRDTGLCSLDSEPESDSAANSFPESSEDDEFKDLPQDIKTSTESIETKQDEPLLVKREKENGNSPQLIPESPSVHRTPSDPWPKLSQGTDKTDRSGSSEDSDVSSTLSPQDGSQRRKLMEAYKRRLDTIQDKDYEYEDPAAVKETQVRRSLSFSDEDGEGYKIRPGVIILDPR